MTPTSESWINHRFVQICTCARSTNVIQVRREQTSLFLLNLPCAYLYAAFILALWTFAGCKTTASLSQHKTVVEDSPSTFLEVVQIQCQHLEYKSRWAECDHTGGAPELDLLYHWTTATEVYPKCKEIALWGHFASISPFGSVPLCLQC